uniref:Phytanoyl-CoA hydroxylase-interacting protein-like C-terminal domain-containing protein n=1 Tax=Plectus sambesii TaxID=2011161 RepID=A0A914WWF9_9BILA
MSLFGKSDYYAEEKSLSAAKTVGRPPAQNNTTAMGSKMYGKSMHEYEDVDIETLLSKLSPDELLELNNDFDPDNSLLPPSQRIRDQTDKDPTGPFQREKLLKFLEEKAHNEKDWEERVPYNPGEKRGKVFVSEDQQRSIDSNDDPNNMDMPIELDVDDELEEALEAAPERDLVDLAGILGMHSMLSQAQYYNALKGKPQDETTGMSFTGVIKSSLPKIIPEEPPNQTNVDDCIERLQKDDSEMTDINLNNMKRVPKERIKTLIKTAAQSTHLRKFSLANTAITDAEARMWGHNPDYDNYWPEYESEYRPVPGWHGPRRHRMDLTLPGPYGGGPRRMFRPDLLSTPHAAPRQLAPPFRPRAPVSQERSNAEKLYQDFNDPARPSPIAMEYQASAVKCEVSWRAPVLHRSIEFVYRVDAAQGTQVETMELGPHKTLLRMKTTPGQWYTVEVRAVTAKPENRIVAFGSVQFKAVFSREEMLMLHKRAVEFVGTSMHPFRVIYRCKPKPYFDDIRYRTGAIMEKYLKDNNGQAASSINGVISGLFFSARLLPDGSLPLQSPFGDIRMVIPAPTILDPGRVRMYFSDFYCNYITHYVTVVICERGSETDRFCERRLIPLSPENNPFLRIIPRHDVFDTRYEYWVNKNVWVEIYYTEHVPLSWGMFDTITATGAGTSKPGGLPHNKTCQQCNLYPVGRPAADAHASQMAERKRAADEAGEDTDDILSMVKRPRMRDEKDFGDDIADINSTFHLVMEMERERLLAEGASADALLEPGNVDMIEVVRSVGTLK